MAVIAVGDVLKRASDFECMLTEYYLKLAEQTTREGVRLLTDYMGRHRRRLSEALERFPSDEYRRICALPIRYEPGAALEEGCFETRELPPDATAAQVLDIAVELDECLLELYRHVLRQEIDPDVKDLFESLVRTEERDEIRLKKIKAMDYF